MLSGIGHGLDYNDAVYYLNGNVVLYNDSASTLGASGVTDMNYTITVKGANFEDLLTSVGGLTDVEGKLWLENNSVDLDGDFNFNVVNDSTITFNIGYDAINALTDCTSGVVRPTLALGTATGGFHMTGLHFFLDIVE